MRGLKKPTVEVSEAVRSTAHDYIATTRMK
jgi:hypothetical protein